MAVSGDHCCRHTTLRTIPSPHASEVGYQPFSTQQLFTASTGLRRKAGPSDLDYLNLYPAPLVLPDDELAYDPKEAPQSFATWKSLKERNAITPERGVVYVANYPIMESMFGKRMRSWSTPDQGHGAPTSPHPAIEDVLKYMKAFFHGMPVKILNDTLIYAPWTEKPPNQNKRNSRSTPKPLSAEYASWGKAPSVGLQSPKSDIMTRIRVRHGHFPEPIYPLVAPPEPYLVQLNLDDLLDHAIAILPSDAFALLLLVDHDLYEDEEDDFCVGRAYGGSRIAVVSAARYKPELDHKAGIDLRDGHWWPGSHCEEFIQRLCADELLQQPKSKKRKTQAEDANGTPINSESPLGRAMVTHKTAVQEYIDKKLWFSPDLYTRRLCLTASHEVLHCFGLGHCVYFACAMQGTSSLIEDSRQPPYLCPVCENKLAAAIALKVTGKQKLEDRWWNGEEVRLWKEGRRKALIRVCERWEQPNLGFGALASWYRRLADIQAESSS